MLLPMRAATSSTTSDVATTPPHRARTRRRPTGQLPSRRAGRHSPCPTSHRIRSSPTTAETSTRRQRRLSDQLVKIGLARVSARRPSPWWQGQGQGADRLGWRPWPTLPCVRRRRKSIGCTSSSMRRPIRVVVAPHALLPLKGP